jgi:hypothetical protein
MGMRQESRRPGAPTSNAVAGIPVDFTGAGNSTGGYSAGFRLQPSLKAMEPAMTITGSDAEKPG